MKTKLSEINLLVELEKPEYETILGEFNERSFPKNSIICSPNYYEDLIFIVKQGTIRIYLAFEDKEFLLAILTKGGIFSTHTRCFAETLEDVKLLIMPTIKFHGFMSAYPIFSKTIIRILGELLKQSFSIIDSLVFKDVTQRIVEFFLYEARHNGKKDPAGTRFIIDLTMEQVASVVGSSRQTVSTIINQMLRDGTLSKVDRRTYVVPNLDILKEFPHT